MAPPVAVLGMHRSGTSSLAGSLEEAGLHLGEVVTRADHNRKGNRESLAVRDLNDRLLEHNGGAWDRPPAHLVWDDDFRTQRTAVIAAHAADWRWGFKDPRTLLTLPFWQEALPDLDLVGTFRHPLAVAASLERRDGLAPESGLRLWAAYNERLLAVHVAAPFPLVSFDLPTDDYVAAVRSMARALDLPGEPGFFSEELRHHGPVADAELPAEVASLYRRLQDLAAVGP
ncbi:MAG: hypothetical protein KDB35_19225 [Acidimicrobiales bacterium]|nr:hypothetical protein [Acidimicrobiales bacterium]